MKEIKDKKWANNVKEGANAIIQTELGTFHAYINNGWASVKIDNETTYNFVNGEFEVVATLKK